MGQSLPKFTTTLAIRSKICESDTLESLPAAQASCQKFTDSSFRSFSPSKMTGKDVGFSEEFVNPAREKDCSCKAQAQVDVAIS